MIVEVSVALIACIMIVGTVFFVRFLLLAGKALESTKKDIHHVSTETVDLMHKMDSLVSDIKSKSDSLDVVFRPLKSITKGRSKIEASETVTDVVEWVSASFSLFNKIRNAVKRREK